MVWLVREHQRKVAEEPDWPLEDRLNSWARLDREYTKLRQGGHTPSPAGSEIGLSESDLDSKRFTKEIETFQALNVEKLALNDRLKLERNSSIQSWHEGWNRQREERSSGARTPDAERAAAVLEDLRNRISMIQSQIARLPEEEQRLQAQLDDLAQSEQDLETQEALDREIAQLRSNIAPLESRLDREGFSEDEHQRLVELNQQLTETLARQPKRLREELEAQLLQLRGSIENLSMGQPGRRQEFMQELREFRNSQREIIRESQERLQIRMGAAQTTLVGSELEAERTRLEAELTQVEADASGERATPHQRD